MNDNVKMEHMTMKEYIAVAMMSELATKDAVLKMISDGEITATKVVESCFNWADIFMSVRESRNAKT
ncbi:hypothetical protein UFOVP252_35 [uncultured Caudovirales phage]|uniref:Uncharacterized protein n=1 Tax=uncultured Caudovirales phage TaxID=2100421 RepID=A0A6J5LIQ2_9CAUD|nr:hypothetical protein UFOVP252_35 [uncultured Caudovirales phage]